MRILLPAVDDEPLARKRLRRMVEQLADTTIAGERGDADAAMVLVRSARPDVILLDIQMPGRDGIALAREFADGPAIIFTTAHGRFAVDAFDTAAVDYLSRSPPTSWAALVDVEAYA